MDFVSKERRSAMMGLVRRKNTRPEVVVRRLLHAIGCRFRLHRADLPGSPDIVLPSKKLAIFVHGCFWHRHAGCRKTTTPADNAEFWLEKFRQNKLRDRSKTRLLRRQGWAVM